ncbi:MAG TPA: DinB family protein, partial [Sediminibacterium sp.]|nr:DinB family protein [Sediminibacterium sp.]
MARPLPADFPPYFARYIDLVKADSPAEAIHTHGPALHAFFHAIPAGKADYRYESGKWTIKSVLQHVIDTELIFAYRLLRISR